MKKFNINSINSKKIFYFLLFLFLTIIVILILNNKKSNVKKIKIGVMQIVEYEALDKARQGFIDEFKKNGYEDGKNIEFDFQNASGDLANCTSIANKFVGDKDDLIFAISTPCAQAALNSTKNIPIVCTAITDPEGAGLVKNKLKSDTNCSVISDLPPVSKQINLMKKLNDNIKTIGILYSSNEISSEYQKKIAEIEIEKLGIKSKNFNISSSIELQQIYEKMINDVDSVYVIMDKTTFSGMALISEFAIKNSKFIVCSDEGAVELGSIGTYGMDYYKLGVLSAQKAIKILNNELKIGESSVEYLEQTNLKFNFEILKRYLKIIDNKLKDNILKEFKNEIPEEFFKTI